MIAPNKLIGNVTSLANLSKPGYASVITTHYGVIIEANSEAATLLNAISGVAMTNALLVSYAHRASAQGMRNAFNHLKKFDSFESNTLKLRPRSGIPFLADIKGRVIARTEGIFLVFWELRNAEVVQPSGEWFFNTGT